LTVCGLPILLARHDRTSHSGPARVFNSEEEAHAAIKVGRVKPGDVVVAQYEGTGIAWLDTLATHDSEDRHREIRRVFEQAIEEVRETDRVS